MRDTTIAFIGTGNMAGALISGLLADGVPAQSLIAADPSAEKRRALESATGIRTTADNNAAVAQADVVVLAVKPQVLKGVAQEIAAQVQQRAPLVVSVAAGVRCDALSSWLGNNVALIRTMPNTPALVGAGATAIAVGGHATDDDLAYSDFGVGLRGGFSYKGSGLWVGATPLGFAATNVLGGFALGGQVPSHIGNANEMRASGMSWHGESVLARLIARER